MPRFMRSVIRKTLCLLARAPARIAFFSSLDNGVSDVFIARLAFRLIRSMVLAPKKVVVMVITIKTPAYRPPEM